MTRLFVAAWPPRDVAERLALHAHAVDAGVRAVPVDHLHVTLRYIGDADADAVAARLERAHLPDAEARFGPKIIRLDERQFVVPVDGAGGLAAAVRAATAGLGESSRRRFFGHVTIARARRGATSTLEGVAVSGTFRLDDVRLVESRLEPTGAVYTTVRRVRPG